MKINPASHSTALFQGRLAFEKQTAPQTLSPCLQPLTMPNMNHRLIPGLLLLTFTIAVGQAQDNYGTKPSPGKKPGGNKPAGRPSRPASPAKLDCREKDVSPGSTKTGLHGIEFVEIPGGTFCMGSTTGEDDEKPVHRVTVKGFEIGKYEVTQAQWEAVAGTKPSHFKDCPDCPVEKVSWNDVKDFLTMLNTSGDGYRYRLPTEAEWEYACRAGTVDEYAGILGEMGWFNRNSASKAHPVGGKRPNAFGLYDMHGNVWEWCEDTWHDNYRGAAANGATWTSGPDTDRVLRGGSWSSLSYGCRSAFRYHYAPFNAYNDLGFRVVRVPWT